MKAKYLTLIFLLFILFLSYGCGEKSVEDTTSNISIDDDVDEVDNSISEIDDAELDQIDIDLEYLEDI